MSGITRRDFFKRAIASGVAGGLVLSGFGKRAAASTGGPLGSIIDLTKCDGCQDLKIPACVQACRTKNKDRFPKPAKEISNYWPQPKKEDWSDKKNLINRLTPYNWTFVQKVSLEHNGKNYTLFIPRRCMHCDNPPCANLCPFSAQEKTPEGPVVIDPNVCFGGAKCRDVCPWEIPARQAGVGLYMKIAPKYVGGGVMYKCDSCYDLIKVGKTPACAEACPRSAITFGNKNDMLTMAKQKVKNINGFIYGEKENGGTSTFYISPVPFEKINQQLLAQKEKQPNPTAPGFPGMPVNTDNILDSLNGIVLGALVAPIAGAVAAGYTAYKTMKGEE